MENNSPKDYVVFLQLLLQTEYENWNGDSRHIYAVLQANLDKLNLNFIPIIQEAMAKIMGGIDDPEQAEGIAAYIENIAIKIYQFPGGRRADNIEIAIAAYKIALSALTFETNPKKWAQTQNNLAIAYSNRIRGETPDNVEMAIAFYTAALKVYTREAFPEQWAAIQNNLGSTYLEHLRGDRGKNLEAAIRYFLSALEVYTRENFPKQSGMTQQNLGIAYGKRLWGDRGENLEAAIHYYSAALEVYTRKDFPEKWAVIQNNLGSDYLERVKGDKGENLETAIRYFLSALEVYTRGDFPEKWATTQQNLGIAYRERISGEKAENLEAAIRYFSLALEILTPEGSPEEWAITQNNLGIAYRQRLRGKWRDNLEVAIRCFSSTLEIFTPEKFPEDWAASQTNIGNTYRDRIEGDKVDNLEKVIQSYLAALEVLTSQAFPEKWATLQNNLGVAYLERLTEDRAENLEAAIRYFSSALEVRTRQAFPYDWAMTQNNLGITYRERLTGDRVENLETAIHYFSSALEVRTRQVFPEKYAATQSNLGFAYQDTQQFQSAYTVFADAIDTIESLRSEIVSGSGTEGDKQTLAQQWNNLYRRMVEVCLQLNKPTAAIEYVERSKARNLVELLANKDIYPKLDIYANSELYQTHCHQLEQLRRQIPAKQRELQILISSQKSEEENRDRIKLLRLELNQLQQQQDELLSEINQIDTRFTFTQEVESIPFSDIQSLTDENTAIVEWYITGSQILTFIITCHHPHPIVVSSSFEDMTALTNWDKDYRDLYQKPKNEWINNLASRLQNLAEILHIDDIISSIDDCFSQSGAKCNRLILMPHRYLHLFPLHALPLADGKLLFERFSKGVGYAPSCQLLKQAKDQEQNRPDFTRLFAIQNPTRKKPGSLLGSQLEIDKIRQHFDPQHTIILKEAEATEANLYQSMEQIRSSHCLHFSCHGKFDFESPLKSALLLTDPEDKLGEEAMLTLGEVFEKLYLNQCRLVTFSACESGMTDPHSISDEYIGLPSGFLYAGSLSVVSTLWSVDPIATTLLMVKFYHNLKRLSQIQTGDVAIALNKAQKWLRSLTNKKLAIIKNHPSFQLQLKQAFENQEDDLDSFNLLLNQAVNTKKPDRQPYPFANPYYWSAFVAIGL
ncbi:CHAT domain-containing protein [Microcoleus sp.]|uniref:CHAT domain-containing protein n=1 Tax=Microcoleus sp. TaxID=44472 RepID=UPI003525DECE